MNNAAIPSAIGTIRSHCGRLLALVLWLLSMPLIGQIIQVSEAEEAAEPVSFSRILSLIAMLILAQTVLIALIWLICRISRNLTRKHRLTTGSPYTIPPDELEPPAPALADKDNHAPADHR